MIDEFVTGWAKGGPKPGTHKTTARMLWNDQGFYFLAEMADEPFKLELIEFFQLVQLFFLRGFSPSGVACRV